MTENGGKYMIREYVSGEIVEKSKYWVPAQVKRRSPKKAASSHRKQDENDQAAVKMIARLINCNGKHGDLWLTPNYSDDGLVLLCRKYGIDENDIDSVKKAADHEMTLYLRRLRRIIGPAFWYIAITSDMDGETGALERIHHHIIMPRLAFEECQKQWKYGSVDYKILKDQKDYTPIAVYICKQCRRAANEHRWHPSKNLKKPKITETETHVKGELHIPHGATVLDIGHYDIESGNHYVRYIRKKKPVPTAEMKLTAKKKAAPVSSEHTGGRRNL